MKSLLFTIALALFAIPAAGQVFEFDSVIAPVMESYDTDCDCYTEQVILCLMFDSTTTDNRLVFEFGYRPFGSDSSLWVTAFTFADSAGHIVTRAAIVKRPDRFDVSRDGRRSILDVALLITELFLK